MSMTHRHVLQFELYRKNFFLMSNRNDLLDNIAALYPLIIKKVYTSPSRNVISVIAGQNIKIFLNQEHIFTAQTEAECVALLEWTINNFFLQNLTHLLHIHAAALAFNGRGILLPATNGVGKSTFTLYLTQKGFNFYSDEIGLIDPICKKIFPFPKSISLDRKVLKTSLSSATRQNIVITQHAEKVFYRPAVRKKDLTKGVPLRYIFFLRRDHHDGAPSPLAPCSTGQGLMELIKNSFSPLAPNEKKFAQLMDALSRVNIYFLDNSHLERAYKAIKEVITVND